jgi:hypothetical protein
LSTNTEKKIPLCSRFLDSQVFIDEKERSIMYESDNNTSEEAPLFYEINIEKSQLVYLLRIPIGIISFIIKT